MKLSSLTFHWIFWVKNDRSLRILVTNGYTLVYMLVGVFASLVVCFIFQCVYIIYAICVHAGLWFQSCISYQQKQNILALDSISLGVAIFGHHFADVGSQLL